MILWTIQSEEVYRKLLDTGYYHCEFSRSHMQEWKRQYDWLVEQMKKRIGPPPTGVTYPVWAWHTWRKGRRKPDLRNERWGNGWKGDQFVRMEIDVPVSEVLCSDFDAWSIILLDGFLCDSEEEDNRLESIYQDLSSVDQRKMKSINWEGAFDLTPKDNGWIRQGECIQATFWELKREYVKKVTAFTSATPKPDYIDENGDIIEERLPGRKCSDKLKAHC